MRNLRNLIAILLVLFCVPVSAQFNNCDIGGLCSVSSGASPLTPYTGQIATRTYLPDASNTTNKQLRSRTIHQAKDDIVNPTLIFPNFYVDGFGAGATYQELGVGAASTITASIEYPLGSGFTAANCGGGSIPNISTLSCTVTISIPKGDFFGVRTFINNTAGIVFSLGVSVPSVNVPGNFGYGDVLDAAPSGLTDNTLGGTYTATGGSSRYSPIIIAAQTTLPSVLVIGDSKAYGENDTGDGAGDVGETQRWLSPFYGVANWGIRGRDAGQFVANCAIQCSFASYFTHLINEDGVNGFIHGQNAATVATNTDALGNKFPSLKKYITTILPVATTTDNYATLANQTTAAYNAGRVTENDRRRSIPAPWLGVFDSADAVESSRNSGLVATQSPSGTLNYFNSSSSVHPSNGGYERISEFNRSLVQSAINRNGIPVTFTNRVFVTETDHGEDATSQLTYTFANKLLGSASANRLIIVGCTARLGTTSATSASASIGGVSATKIVDLPNTTGGALTLQSVWAANVPSSNVGNVSITYSTTMLRAGCDIYNATGSLSLPTISSNQIIAAASNVATTPALTVPLYGGAIIFSSAINGTAPTATYNGFVSIIPITNVGGTLYYTSGSLNQQGSKAFTVTYSVATVATAIAIAVSP